LNFRSIRSYVIVFTGLAGGASDRLLAAAPVLMLVQMALLPVYLLVFVGPDVVSAIDPAPFLQALAGLIVIPLALAALTQALARRPVFGRTVTAAASSGPASRPSPGPGSGAASGARRSGKSPFPFPHARRAGPTGHVQ
jgi:hypothetical protein